MRAERRVIRMFVVCALVLFVAGVTDRTARAANPIENNQNPPTFKSRTLSTGRQYSARAIRPNMAADVVIDSPEIQDVLVNSYAWGGVRKSSVYTTQELFDHARGMFVRMDMNRIGGVLTESGPGAPGTGLRAYARGQRDEWGDRRPTCSTPSTTTERCASSTSSPQGALWMRGSGFAGDRGLVLRSAAVAQA